MKMKLTGTLSDIVKSSKGDVVVSFAITNYSQQQLLDKLVEDKYSISVEKYREQRSLNANAYMWHLVNEIANMLSKSKEDIYFIMLQRYGKSEMVSVISSIDVDGYFKYYQKAGTSILNGKEFTHYKVYKGSSEYDTKEMATLIDGIVQEAQELDIQTLEDIELKRLVDAWKK